MTVRGESRKNYAGKFMMKFNPFLNHSIDTSSVSEEIQSIDRVLMVYGGMWSQNGALLKML